MSASGWIGVDLDGTLAEYHGWDGGRIGRPIQAMVNRVDEWIKEGVTVKIVTARAGDPDEVKKVKAWLEYWSIPITEVTDRKDFSMVELWDDRAIQVIPNTGERADGK